MSEPHSQQRDGGYTIPPVPPLPVPVAQQPTQPGQYQPAPNYQQPMYIQAPPPQTVYAPAPVYVPAPTGRSSSSMWLGIISIIFGFTFFLPLIGLVLGISAIRKEPAGRGMAVTGIILNGMFVLGWAIVIAIVVTVMISAGLAASTSTTYTY